MPIASVQAKQPSALIQVNALCILLMLICARETGAQRRRYATSASGQLHHFERAPITSGLPRKADSFRASRHFAFVPTSEVKTSYIRENAAFRS
jgi:hypothetical protein